MPNYVYICTDPQCGFVDEIIEVHAMTKEEDDARPDQDRPVCSRSSKRTGTFDVRGYSLGP